LVALAKMGAAVVRLAGPLKEAADGAELLEMILPLNERLFEIALS